ncbi:MAG: hypothetical protein ABIH23_08660 [bacterium]
MDWQEAFAVAMNVPVQSVREALEEDDEQNDASGASAGPPSDCCGVRPVGGVGFADGQNDDGAAGGDPGN